MGDWKPTVPLPSNKRTAVERVNEAELKNIIITMTLQCGEGKEIEDTRKAHGQRQQCNVSYCLTVGNVVLVRQVPPGERLPKSIA